MKTNIIKRGILLFLVSIIATSCIEYDGTQILFDDGSNNSTNDGQVSLTIDGIEYTSDGQDAFATLLYGVFNLTVNNSSTGEMVTVTVSNASEGTFDLGTAANALNGAAYNINSGDGYLSGADGGSGQINITKLDVDNLLTSGTFEFVGTRFIADSQGNITTETITVTDGSFSNITLTTELISVNDDTFSADIDGVAFNPDFINAIEMNSKISITVINNSTAKNIGLSFTGSPTVGTHELGDIMGDYTGLYNPNMNGGTTVYYSNPGTITITSYNAVAKTIEGTFEFTAKSFIPTTPDVTYEITNGEFFVNIN